ncbi:Imm52 family immunity protein [Kribbella sp. NPDC048915]|uniref:Imm52 family immunity protein n=1 Tax=Kribbella sp. NPDC048915 TaxID=3155148 RepID=UPI0033F19985
MPSGYGNEELMARGFWGPRQESAEPLADRLVGFLWGLDGAIGETLRWSSSRPPGKPIAEPVHALQMLADAFDGNTDAPHLGVTQSYQGRGEKTGDASITMSVGGFSDSPNVRNSVVLKWRDGVDVAGVILRQLVSAWDPDWAAVAPRSFQRAMTEVQPVGSPGPKLGCLTYLSEGRAQALPGGMDKYVEKLDNGGVVIGSGEGDGFLSLDKATELVEMLGSGTALSPVPTDRSKY